MMSKKNYLQSIYESKSGDFKVEWYTNLHEVAIDGFNDGDIAYTKPENLSDLITALQEIQAKITAEYESDEP